MKDDVTLTTEIVNGYELRIMHHHKRRTVSATLYVKGVGLMYGPPHGLSLNQITSETGHLVQLFTPESAREYALKN